MSALYWNDDKPFPGTDRLIPNGYKQLCDILSKGIDIQLNMPVCAIQRQENGVHFLDGVRYYIRTESGDVCCGKHVIVTVPIGVLQKNTIHFDPPLPPKYTKAISQFGLASLNWVVLIYDTMWWPDRYHNITYYVNCTRASGLKWPWIMNRRTINPNCPPCLLFVKGGDVGLYIQNTLESELVIELTSVLSSLFGVPAPPPVRVIRTNWASDPYSMCSYSFKSVHFDHSATKTLATPIQRLHFAGEATDRKNPATVHGAHLSGVRAALNVIKSFGK